MRKIYWYITAYIKKHGLTFFASVVFAILLFSVLIPLLGKRITVKQKKFVGIVGEYTLSSLPPEIKNKLSVGLTKIEPEDQSVKPLVAQRWITQDEGKTFRFTLKKAIKGQDGQELVPADVNYNFKDVETITTPNDVIFKLPDQFAPFPSVVAEPLFKQGTKNYLFFFKKPTLIGIGPAKVSSYTLKNNHLTEMVVDSPEERTIYRFYLTEKDAILGFKKGEVDYLPDLTNPEDLLNWDQVVIEEKINYDQYLAIFFNNSDPLFNKNIRQALSYAVDKPDEPLRAIGPINPNSWAYLEGGKDYDQDYDRAVERLLDGLPPKRLDLTLTTTSVFIPEAEEVKQQWEQLGQRAYQACQSDEDVENKQLCEHVNISTNIKVTNFPDTQNYQLLLMGQEIPVDPDQYFLWHSDQSTNFTNYQNTRIDSLLEKGRQTIDQNKRKEVYQEFQQFLLEDPPAIFLRHLVSFDVKRD